MNVITVFRDPGWSLDVVTNMPKMQWIPLYTDMIEAADVFINGKRVLWSKADGANVSDALKQLTRTLCVKYGVTCTPVAVFQRCRLLRKQKMQQEQDATMTELEQECSTREEQPDVEEHSNREEERAVTGGKGPAAMAQMRNERTAKRVREQSDAEKDIDRQERRADELVTRAEKRVRKAQRAVSRAARHVDKVNRNKLDADQDTVRDESAEEEQQEAAHDESAQEEQVFSTRDEKRAAVRVQKALDAVNPGVLNEGGWAYSDVEKVMQWMHDHPQDESKRHKYSDAFKVLVEEVHRTERGTWDKMENIRKVRPTHVAQEVVAPAVADESQYYEEENADVSVEELLEFMKTNRLKTSHSNGAASFEEEVLVSGNVEFPGIVAVHAQIPPATECCMEGIILSESDDEYDSDEFHGNAAGKYTEEELRQMNTRVFTPRQMSPSNGAATTAAPAPQALVPFSYIEAIKMVQAYEAGAAAGSSSGAAATATPARDQRQLCDTVRIVCDTIQDNYLIESLAAAAGSSNGAAATATPAAPTLLPLAAMNPEYIAKCFGIRNIRVEYVTKFQATLEAFREMENNGAITLGFKTQNLSIFGMTSIHVIDQNKWNETMIKYARSYTRHRQLETKNYQAQIYHLLWSLGFHSWGTDETAHKANGSKSTHICHNAWNYTHKAFLEKKGRCIGLGHA